MAPPKPRSLRSLVGVGRESDTPHPSPREAPVLHHAPPLPAYSDASDVRSHNAALIALSKRGGSPRYLGHLLAAFATLLKCGARHDHCTYYTLINAHCKSSRSSRTSGPHWCGCEDGLAPDTFTCNSLMLGLCRGGILTAARGVFVQMPRRWGVYHDAFSPTPS